jgi:hypothetical protein
LYLGFIGVNRCQNSFSASNMNRPDFSTTLQEPYKSNYDSRQISQSRFLTQMHTD